MEGELNTARISDAIGYDVEVSKPNGPAVHGYITARWADSRQADFNRFVARIKAEAWDDGFCAAEEQHDGFAGVSGWTKTNPYREED